MAGKNAGAQVDVTGLESSLQDLLKAANVTDLKKGALGATIAIDSTGHHDERGEVNGGYPEQEDVGVLDSMMVGKMQQALMNAGFDVNSIAAFMGGEEGEEQEEGGEEGEDEQQMPPGRMGGAGMPPRGMPIGKKGKNPFAKMAKMEAKLAKMRAKFGAPASTEGGVGTNPREEAKEGEKTTKKSMDAFAGDSAIAEAIDVSPFLQALVQQTSDQIDGLTKSLKKSRNSQADVNRALAAALYGVGQVVKSISGVTEALNERLQLVEATPMPQRGITGVDARGPQRINTSARPRLVKSLPASGGGGESLSKSQVLNVLSYMNLEKGIKEIGGQKTSEIACMFEGGGGLSPSVLQTVKGFLSSNPHLAPQALSYR